MATIDSLANETLIRIMELLKEPSTLDWDNLVPEPGRYDALRAAALVCSRWRDPAQRALFDDVELSDWYPLRSERFLSSPAQPRYRTTSLWVARATEAMTESDGEEAIEATRTRNKWIDVAKACRGLLSLEILWKNFWFDLDSLATPCFAGLEYLSIYAPSTLADPDALPGTPLALTQLSSFALFDQSGGNTTLSTIFTSSERNIHTLRLRKPTGGGPHTALPDIGPHLHSLTLEVTNDGLPPYCTLFPTLSALKSFILIEIEHGISADPFAVHLLPSILDAFPPTPTLRHLSLDIEVYSSLEYIIKLLPHPTLNLLAKLEFPCLPRWTPVSETTIVVLMAEACQQRGIEWSMGGLEMNLLRANSIATSEEDLCMSLQRVL